MIKKNVHKYSLKQEASRKKIEEEERKAQEYGAYLQYSIPVYNSPSSHGTKKMEKPPGKCFSGKYISLSWIAVIPQKLTELIILLGLLEHAADSSRSSLDWNISLRFFPHHTYQLMALKLQSWNLTGSSVFNW